MINFAVIGTNFITDWFVNATKCVNDVDVVAVYSRTEEKGQEYAQKMGISKVYTSIEKMCEDKDIDAVYVANPTAFHYETTIKALKAKKHVLCEKPFASNEEQVLEMINTAQENGVVVMEAMRSVHNETIEVIRNNLSKLGAVRNVKFSFCQYSSRYDKFKNGIVENAFKRELSNGALMDIGSYVVHTAINLFGKPKDVATMGYSLENSIDGVGVVLLGYDDKICQLSYSKITDGMLENEIQGEKGSMLIDKIACPEKIRIIYRDGTEEVLYDKKIQDDMSFEIEYFVKWVNKEVDLKHALENSLYTIQVLDKVRKMQGIKFPCDRS